MRRDPSALAGDSGEVHGETEARLARISDEGALQMLLGQGHTQLPSSNLQGLFGPERFRMAVLP